MDDRRRTAAQRLGDAAEERVAEHLQAAGWTVLGRNVRMGRYELDLVGLDVRLAIAEHLHRELKAEGFRPPALMRRIVEEGKLGKKTGQGFYKWE